MPQTVAFTGGDDIGAVVAEFGSYTTKMGFAGEDFPRALFRSNIGILREQQQQQEQEQQYPIADDRVKRQRGRVKNTRYDIISKPMMAEDGSDGDWEVYNPTDPTTGLHHLRDNFESKGTSDEKGTSLITEMMQHGIKSSLGSVNMSTCPLLMIEKPYTAPNHRQKLAEVLFEEYSIPSLFLSRDAVLSCYACGRTTSSVVDIGEMGTNVTPVYDGFVEQKGIVCSKIGGHALDLYMLQLMDSLYKLQYPLKREIVPFYQVHSRLPHKPARDPEFHKLSRLDVARTAKEDIGMTASITPGYDISNLDANYANMIKSPFELPDGTLLQIGHERYAPCELLFGTHDNCSHKREDITIRANKKRAALNQQGLLFKELSSNPIQNIVCDSVFQCDRDQQAQLLGNIVVTGGGSNIPGLTDRLRDEVEAIIHKHTPGWRVKVVSPGLGTTQTNNNNNVSAWLGGSILASLGSFQDMWMTKHEYEEYGAHYVNRKCP